MLKAAFGRLRKDAAVGVDALLRPRAQLGRVALPRILLRV
jgi:hypothetical protein